MAFLEDPRLRERWNQISQNAETVTENAAAGIWTFQHTYINPCLNSVNAALDSCTSVCLGDRDDRARRQRERARSTGHSPEYSFDFYDDWYDDYYGPGGLEEDGVDGNGAGGGSGSGSGSGGLGSIFGRGFFGTWSGSRAEDWDRLLAGSGSTRGRHGDGDEGDGGGGNGDGGGVGGGEGGGIVDQPRRRRGMSYGTRGMRRKMTNDVDDPTIIPSTAPLGFLGRLPFKIGGTLRYKPSAANLQEHPGGGDGLFRKGHSRHSSNKSDEHEPLLGSEAGADVYGAGETLLSQSVSDLRASATRKRSGTTGSGDTSDSYRSRGDLFPSDEEDDEDAIPLDDEFAVALDRVGDDRSSGRTRFSSSSSLALVGGQQPPPGQQRPRRKGKKRASTGTSTSTTRGVLSRSVSRTTIASVASSMNSPAASIKQRLSSRSLPVAMAEEEGEAAAGGDTESLASASRQSLHSVHSVHSIHSIHSIHDTEEDVAGHSTVLSSPTSPLPATEVLSLEQIHQEEERLAREEHEAIERKRRAAIQLARERGLAEEVKEDDVLHIPAGGGDAPSGDALRGSFGQLQGVVDVVVPDDDEETALPAVAGGGDVLVARPEADANFASQDTSSRQPPPAEQPREPEPELEPDFVPARLPNFS